MAACRTSTPSPGPTTRSATGIGRTGSASRAISYDAANALKKSCPVGGGATYYSYDLNGNCTKILAPNSQTTYFFYNSVNLMTRVTFRNGITNYFCYDALNRRRVLADSNGPAYFMYDQHGLCQLVERNNTGNVRAEYTRGSAPIGGIGDMVAAKINTVTTTYYQYPDYDPRGNLQRTVNASGAITGSFEYNALGEKLLNQPPAAEGTRFGFSAPAWITPKDDPDNVLIWTPTRNYHTAAGTFLQRNPRGFIDGLSLYAAYLGPQTIDPTGLDRWMAPIWLGPIRHVGLCVDVWERQGEQTGKYKTVCCDGEKRLCWRKTGAKKCFDFSINKTQLWNPLSRVAAVIPPNPRIWPSGQVTETDYSTGPGRDLTKHNESGCKADTEFLWEMRRQKAEPQIYNAFFYNCNEWSLRYYNYGADFLRRKPCPCDTCD